MTRFHTIEDARGQEFYQLPKDLIKNKLYKDLSANAKIAYAILKDRHSVSLKNEWIDELGRVYFLLSDNELADILDTSVRTASRYKNDLQNSKLIHMERQGLNRRNKIYLLKPESAVLYNIDKKPSINKDKTFLSSPDMTKMSSPNTTKLSSQDTTILSTYSKNELSNNNFSNKEEEEEAAKLSNLISYFQKNITDLDTTTLKKELIKWLHVLPFDVIEKELENCALYGGNSWKYVEKVLIEDKKLNIVNLEQLEEKHNNHETLKKRPNTSVSRRKAVREEVVPDFLKVDYKARTEVLEDKSDIVERKKSLEQRMKNLKC